MARKELNVLSLSFLDLLSGALAAVIILFVVVPKLSKEQAEAIEALEKMEVNISQLDSLLKSGKETMSSELYQQLSQQLEQLQSSNIQLKAQVEQLQTQVVTLQQAAKERDSIRAVLEHTRKQLDSARVAASGGGGAGQTIFGLDADLGIVASWQENVDVDLYVRERSTGQWCFFDNPRPSFASYLNDITSRTPGDTRYELVYQLKVKPGTYDVFIHLYSESGSAKVVGFAVLNPYKPNEHRVEFQSKTLVGHGIRKPQPPNGGGIKIGTLKVTLTSLSLQ
jgi:hypothetical protein